MMGWIAVYEISNWVKDSEAGECVAFIGRNSMSIMLMHFLAFKIATGLLILLYKKPIILLASFHVLYDIPQVYSLMYLLVGIAVPMAVSNLFDAISRGVKNKVERRINKI